MALRIIGSEAALHSGQTHYTDPRVARLGAFLAVRSRFTEDCLAAAGVPQYVLPDAVLETLRILAKTLAAGSQISFDHHPSPPGKLSVEERRAAIVFATRVAAAGKPLRTIFNPQELLVELAKLDLRAQDFNHVTLTERYLSRRADGLALSRHVHIMRVESSGGS